jgi:hypothetical protein
LAASQRRNIALILDFRQMILDHSQYRRIVFYAIFKVLRYIAKNGRKPVANFHWHICLIHLFFLAQLFVFFIPKLKLEHNVPEVCFFKFSSVLLLTLIASWDGASAFVFTINMFN